MEAVAFTPFSYVVALLCTKQNRCVEWDGEAAGGNGCALIAQIWMWMRATSKNRAGRKRLLDTLNRNEEMESAGVGYQGSTKPYSPSFGGHLLRSYIPHIVVCLLPLQSSTTIAHSERRRPRRIIAAT